MTLFLIIKQTRPITPPTNSMMLTETTLREMYLTLSCVIAQEGALELWLSLVVVQGIMRACIVTLLNCNAFSRQYGFEYIKKVLC